jgi:hypothetical protein
MDPITSELAAKIMRPALDAAARRLVQSLEELDRARIQPLEAALKAIIKNPHGCTYCDYGELRRPPKFPHSRTDNTHDRACGYAMAAKLIGANERADSRGDAHETSIAEASEASK